MALATSLDIAGSAQGDSNTFGTLVPLRLRQFSPAVVALGEVNLVCKPAQSCAFLPDLAIFFGAAELGRASPGARRAPAQCKTARGRREQPLRGRSRQGQLLDGGQLSTEPRGDFNGLG